MKKWQKYWLIFIIIVFSIHLVRDVLQDLNSNSLLAASFVKTNTSQTPWWYWWVFNTYLIEITGICLASLTLKKDNFQTTGWITVGLGALMLSAWLYYWFFL